jgi:hypothetical protein
MSRSFLSQRLLAARSAMFAVSALSLAAALLAGCGGGSDSPVPPPPVETWRAPIASGAAFARIVATHPDAGDGVYVVGYDANNVLQIQRYSLASGWQAAQPAAPGLESQSVLATPEGVAVFARDSNNWYRKDFNATGASASVVQFAVSYADTARTQAIDESFTRTHAGNVLATSLVARSDNRTLCRAQTREYKNAAWSTPSFANITSQEGSDLPCALSKLNLVRSKHGDVALVSYSLIYPYSYVAFRATAAASLVGVTAAECAGPRCTGGPLGIGMFAAPTLELDGAATVFTDRFTASRAEWFALRGGAPVSLLPGNVASAAAPASPLARLLLVDGAARWMVSESANLEVWEGTQRAAWSADAAALAACPLARCGAISAPNQDHIAIIQSPSAAPAKLYISERTAAAQWALRDSVDLSSLLAGNFVGGQLAINALYVASNKKFAIGTVQTSNSAATMPFAVVKR